MLEKYYTNGIGEQEEKGCLEKIVDPFKGFTRKVPVYLGIGAILFGASTGLIGCKKMNNTKLIS